MPAPPAAGSRVRLSSPCSCRSSCVAGIWLGGHPDALPGPVRDVLVSDSEGQLYDDAVDLLSRDYYRPVDRKALLDTSIDSAVKSLNDRFSNYFNPKAYAASRRPRTGPSRASG